MEREQFDAVKQIISAIAVNLSAEVEVEQALGELDKMFPEFTQPKFGRCGLCTQTFDPIGDEEIETHKIIDTSPFRIVVDDEGSVYWIPEHRGFVITKYRKDGTSSLIKQDSEEAQQIQKFLEGK